MLIPGYVVGKELGRGGMAIVYQATQTNFGREVALKVMLPHFNVTPGAAERFVAEGRMTARLNHANVISMFDIGCHEGTYFLAAELLLGGTLKERAGDLLTVEEKLRVLRSIARGLDFAHQHHIVHRDVKPVNVMFRDLTQAVVTDFGIAKSLDGAQMAHTQTGTIIGTPHYMSPEQAQGLPLDGRSDLYSLGVMMFELFTGKLPYDAPDMITVLMQHLQSPIPQFPDEFAALQPILNRLMAKQTRDRFDAQQFIRALQPFLQRSPSQRIPVVSALVEQITPQGALVNSPVVTEIMADARPRTNAPDPLQSETQSPGQKQVVVPSLEAIERSGYGEMPHSRWGIVSWPKLLVFLGLVLAALSAALVLMRTESGEQSMNTDAYTSKSLQAELEGSEFSSVNPPATDTSEALVIEQIERRLADKALLDPPGDSAIDLLARYLQASPDSPRALLMAQKLSLALATQTRALLQQGKRAEAFAFAARALQKLPNDIPLSDLRAELQLQLDSQQASPSAAVSINITDASTLVAKAVQLSSVGQKTFPPGDNAVELLQRALASRPGHAPALRALSDIAREYEHVARTWQARGRADQALMAVENGLKAMPEDAALLHLRNQLTQADATAPD